MRKIDPDKARTLAALGKRIADLREKAGMSQADLARACDVPLPTIRNWEQGRREPQLLMAKALADALGVAVTELFPATTPSEPPPQPESEPTPPRPEPKRGRKPKASEGEQQPEVVNAPEKPSVKKPGQSKKRKS